MSPVTGLHHVTAISGAPDRNAAFYAKALGQRLIKKTVNFDDPGTYHLYYGDRTGSAGTVMTFFPWAGAPKGAVGAGQASVTPKQRLIIDGAFEIAERRIEAVLRPRPEVFVVDADASCRDALTALASSGHSRAPVGTGGGLDDVVGVVHLRDLLDHPDRPARDVVSDITALPETVQVLTALHRMQADHVQLALVIDERGLAVGIVTMEDLVEELVGEIYDETDRVVLTAQRAADGSLSLPGQFPLHELVEIGLPSVENDSYTTIAGLILDRLGRIPDTTGDIIPLDGWRLEVTEIDGHRISRVRAVVDPTEAPADGSTDEFVAERAATESSPD
ncbi:MAG: transporter associated domain-containing protein [Actinomycetota bacterium]